MRLKGEVEEDTGKISEIDAGDRGQDARIFGEEKNYRGRN